MARAGWRVAIASAYCLVFGPSSILVIGFGAFSKPLSQAFGWSPAAIALAVTILALVIMVTSPLQGLLTDRYGGRRLILWSTPLFILGLAAMAAMPGDIRLFYLAFVAVPVLALGIWPVSYMKLTGSWFSRHLGLALGTANAGIGLGAIIVPPIAAWTIAQHGWRAAYLVLALLAASTWPIAWLFVRGGPTSGIPADPAVEAAPHKIDWRDRELLIVMAGWFLIGITGTGLLTNLVPMMVRSGLSLSAAILGMSIFGTTALMGRFISGYLLDRFPARWVILCFIGISALGLIAFAAGLSGGALTAAVVAFGLLSGGEFDQLAYCVRRYFGMAVFGRVYGLAFSAFQLGAAFGAAGLSLSLAYTDSYAAGLWMMAASQAIAIAVIACLGPYRHD